MSKRGLLYRSFPLLFLCCFLLQDGYPAFAKTDPSRARAYREDTLLVKFKQGVSADESSNSHRKHGSKKVREFPELRIHQVKLKTGETIEEAIREYSQDPAVEFAEPDYARSINVIPNDLLFWKSWGLNNTGQMGGTPSADIHAPDAWNITKGNRTIVIAVNDTGIDYAHEDLARNVWTHSAEYLGIPGVDDDGNGYVDDVYGVDTYNHTGDPFDDNGHGTHVSGILGASGNNGIGVAGVNWDIQILSCKFFDASGNGYTSGALECLEYERALKNSGVNIVATNNSWGGTDYSQALYEAIKAQQDILFVASAGNAYQDNDLYGWYPANYDLPNIISVAATDGMDKRPAFSSYGRRSVYVAAPGVDILSTLPSDRYGFLSGTSMATPHVTAVAALIVAQNSTRDWRETRNLILSGGENVASWAGVTITGKRLNAYGSLTCADKPVFSALRYPSAISVGVPVTLSALSINCGVAVGPVTVTTSGGDIVTLSDGGIAPDLAAGDGIFTGQWTPTKAGDLLTFASQSGTETISTPQLSIEFENLACAFGIPWSHSLKASGGLPPYVWSLASGALPPGLTLNTATGEISGTAVMPGAFNCTVQVADALNQKVGRPLTIRTTDESLPDVWKSFYDLGTNDQAYDTAVDDNGNVYVTGASYLGSSTNYHILTIKYDPAGNVAWAKTYSGGDYDSAGRLIVDKSGNIYVAGASFWPSYWTVIKYDPSGNVLWTKNIGGHGFASGIAADASGNLYVAGNYYNDLRIIKFDPSGKVIWDGIGIYDGGYYNDCSGGALALDGNGNMYVACGSGGTYTNGRIVKFDPTGQFAWTKTFDEDNDNYLTGTATDKSGNVYAVKKSYIQNHWETLTIKLDPLGNTVWATPYRGYEGNDLAVDEGGNVFVTGYVWNGSAYFFLTIKYDAFGNAVWTRSFGRGCRDLGQAVTADRIGNVYVSGDSCNGSDDDYLTIKYHDPTWVQPPNTTPVASDQALSTLEDIAKTITLTATDADGDSLTYLVVTAPAHGTLSGAAPDLTYHPEADYIGADSFAFKAKDGLADSNTATVSITVAPVAVKNDFDGDGRSDIGCYYPPGGNWYGFNSTEGFWQTQFGYDGTIPVTGDFDGDGTSDIGVYHPETGSWNIFKSTEGLWQTTFGYAGTIPVVGDFDGDGRDDIGCYYPAGGNWYVFKSTEGFWQTTFGYAGTIPVVGDFDGDGRDDIGCYYPPGGNWYVFKSTEGFWQTTFGYGGTIPTVGDFDGDGKSDIGCYYPPGGNWYVFKSTEGFWQTVFGYAGTEPVVGDFDGDGRSDLGCYYPAGGNWYVFKSTEGFWQTQFGYEGTIPIGGTIR